MKVNNIFLITLFMVCLLGTVKAQRGVATGEINAPSGDTNDNYRIYYGGSDVGTYAVEKKTANDKTTYMSTSESSIRIFGTIKVKYDLKSVFRNGTLQESSVVSYKNGKERSRTITKWNGNGYDVVKDGERSTINDPIKKSSVQLYLAPPTPDEQIYSEKEGSMKVVTKKSSNSYLVADPGSSKGSTFQYQGSTLSKVDISFFMGEFSIRR